MDQIQKNISMKKIKLVSILIIFFLAVNITHCLSQTYIGVGYTETYLDRNAINDVKGISIDLQKEISLAESGKWKIIPAAHIGILYTRIDQEFLPAYTTTFSLAPLASFRVLKANFFQLSAFGGPFGSYILGLEGGDAQVSESSKRNYFRGGVELGISTTFAITEELSIKLVPYSIQIGNEDFRNGIISIYFSF